MRGWLTCTTVSGPPAARAVAKKGWGGNARYGIGSIPFGYLIARGCRRIAYIGGDPSVGTGARRIAGYKQALKGAGIAYDPGRHRLFVTGKLWPRIFEIAVLPGRPRTTPGKHTKAPAK